MGLLLFLYRFALSAVFLRRLRRNFLVERCFFHAIKEVLESPKQNIRTGILSLRFRFMISFSDASSR